jgi:hypothetical protein
MHPHDPDEFDDRESNDSRDPLGQTGEGIPPDSMADRPRGCGAIVEIILQRLFVLLMSTLVLVMSVAAIGFLIGLPPPQNFLWRLICQLGLEAAVSFLGVSLLGFIWALFAPRWVDRVFEKSFYGAFVVILIVLLSAPIVALITGLK